MKLTIISTPSHVLHEVLSEEDKLRLKKQVSLQNAAILLAGQLFNVPVRQLIGDPNVNLSEAVCELLEANGLLGSQPWGHGSKLSYYFWLSDDFSVLSLADMELVGWDLRMHPCFYTLTSVEAKDFGPVSFPDPATKPSTESEDSVEASTTTTE